MQQTCTSSVRGQVYWERHGYWPADRFHLGRTYSPLMLLRLRFMFTEGSFPVCRGLIH